MSGGAYYRQHEIDHVRQHDVVHERAAGIEHERRGDEKRHEGALLVPIEARRHEQPDLHRDQRKAHDQRHERRQLHRDEEELEDVEDDDLVAVGQRRLDQEREDRLGEVEGDEEDGEEADQRIDQALAQLDQVIEQRHRLVVFRSVVRLGHGRARSMGAALCRPLARNSKRKLALAGRDGLGRLLFIGCRHHRFAAEGGTSVTVTAGAGSRSVRRLRSHWRRLGRDLGRGLGLDQRIVDLGSWPRPWPSRPRSCPPGSCS